ncbi:hypothetical protein SUGI_0102280 [Cryptomeria japonica]|nr:hypothetical protein SUGI_0102280 [Cryptomeria japonica]
MIARLHTRSPSDKADTVASILSLTKDNPDRNAKLSVEEGVIAPLLILINYKDTSTVASVAASSSAGSVTEVVIRKGQEVAARALGYLGRDPNRVRKMMEEGVCSTFAMVLKEGHMRLQSTVAGLFLRCFLMSQGQTGKISLHTVV